jgi:hypothetical protein
MRIAMLVLIGGLFFTAGCGDKHNPIDGQYQDSKSSLLTFTFDSGKCELSAMGMTKEYSYEFSGDKINLRNANGSVDYTLTRQSDGSLVDDRSGNKLIRTPK